MRKLIPNNITVTEQHTMMYKFRRAVTEMGKTMSVSDIADQLDNIYGITVKVISNRVGGNEFLSPCVVDEKKYLWFLLRWSGR